MDGWDAYWLNRVCVETDCGQAGIHRHGRHVWCSRHVPSEALVPEVAALQAEVERLRAALERVGRASIEEITFSDDDKTTLSCRLCGWSNRWRQSEATWHAPDCVLAE